MNIFNHFKELTLSQDQEIALTRLESFLSSPTKVFILKGYAGSGKTTILKGLISYLESKNKESVVMAPTGRAAKILRDKTGKGTTIHRGIYNFDNLETINDDSEDEAIHSYHYYFPINVKNESSKIIIVDEASMISSKESKNELFTFGTNILLNDLMTYASLTTTENKIIFVGDPAQLPPYGDSHSWALDSSYFEKDNITYDQTELKQVLRQGNNLILKNAEIIRNVLEESNKIVLKLNYDGDSFIKLDPTEIIEKYTTLFPKPEIGDGVIISYSNSQCYHYNVAIRENLFPNEKNIVAGDLLLINTNNYHTYGAELFNGDIAKVINVSSEVISQSAPVYCDENGKKIRKTITLNFREITIRIPSHPNDIVCKIIDSHLHSIKRDLSLEEMKALYINFLIRFNDMQKLKEEAGELPFKVGSEEFKQALKSDSFFNALKVKFGYAITCHKAQGGEWDKVIVDYYGRVSLKSDPLRWCYTATTRGINTVFALNAPNFGKTDKLKFSVIGSVSKLPTESLILNNITLSPFHQPHQHKGKSLKFWEILDKLSESNYTIEKVESFGDFLERYTIRENDSLIQIQGSHTGSGHFVGGFNVINSLEKDEKEKLELIFNDDYLHSFNIQYNSTIDFLEELYSWMQAECSNLEIEITNVIENRDNYYVVYYLKTDSICSYIQFYYNANGQLSTAIPKTFKCINDKKLQSLIQNLQKNAS